jgi:hypothetical protein
LFLGDFSKDVGDNFCWNDSARIDILIISIKRDVIENGLEVRVFTTRQTSSEK